MDLLDKTIEVTEGMAKMAAGTLMPGSIKAEMDGLSLELESLRWIRNEANRGTPLISSIFRPTLSRAMGFVPVNYPWFVLHAADKIQEYRQMVGSMGMPDYACDHLILPNAAILGGDAPGPSVVIETYGECPVMTYGYKLLAEKLGVPGYALDLPVDYTEENIEYLAGQLGELVEFLECKVPGAKYDRDRHLEFMELDGICYRESAKQWRLRARIPFPFTNVDSFLGCATPLARMPSMQASPKKAVELARQKTEQMMALAASVKPELAEKQKLRIFNVLVGPMYVNPFVVAKVLESRGAILASNFAGPTSYLSGIKPAFGDEAEFGRKLTPFEEEARMMLGYNWRQKGDVWVDEILWSSEFLKCNAMIVEQWTDCLCTASLAKIVADKAEKELGIPTTIISHKMQDPTSMSPEDYIAKLTEFLDMALGWDTTH